MADKHRGGKKGMKKIQDQTTAKHTDKMSANANTKIGFPIASVCPKMFWLSLETQVRVYAFQTMLTVPHIRFISLKISGYKCHKW